MKNAINTFTRQATLFLLVFVFAVMSVSVGLSAKALSIDDTVDVYYFTDYDNSNLIEKAVREAQVYSGKYISLHSVIAPGGDAIRSLDAFIDYANHFNIKQNSYAIIELRTGVDHCVADDFNGVHPVCLRLNELTDTLKGMGCKIMLIMGAHEYWFDCYNYYESTSFLDNVDIHINLDFYYLLCYSVLCDIEENGMYDSTVLINKFLSENDFLRDWLLPYLIQNHPDMDSNDMIYYDDLVAQNISSGNNEYLSYLDKVVNYNMSILVEKSVGIYDAFIPSSSVYVKNTISLEVNENLYDMFGNNKYFAVGARYGYEYWQSEAFMLSLRDANDYDVFDIFSYTGGYDDGFDYYDDVIYCGVSDEYIDEYLLPIVVDFLCDNDLKKYDRIYGRCDVTDMPITIGEGKLRFPDKPIARLMHYLL